MMAESPSASSANSSKVTVASPTDKDVTFGRGWRANTHKGNARFRALVREHKEEYTQSKRKRKNEIANDIYQKIHAIGGRFLKQVVVKKENNGDKQQWFPVAAPDALEKVKQALRGREGLAKREVTGGASDSSGRDSGNEMESSGHKDRPIVPEMSQNLILPANSMAVLPTGMLSSQVASPGNAQVLLFQDQLWSLNKQPKNTNQVTKSVPIPVQRGMKVSSVMGSSPFSLAKRGAGAVPMDTGTQRLTAPQNGHHPMTSGSTPAGKHTLADTTDSSRVVSPQVDSLAPTQDGADSAFTSEQDPEVSDFLFQTIFGAPTRPRFTEEQAQVEQASLTREERESALCDMFGRSCTIRQSKRAKRELDELSIRLLVNEMKHELRCIPTERKQALIEAQAKCSAEEFSDSRLLQFLRCEGMDPKLGADRFVLYWECRREVFGPEKYTQCMTLSEALRDDLVALETGFCYLLPSLDISGRQLLLRDPSRHTRQGYTSDSLLRAVWYVIEICSHQNNDADSGFILFDWAENTTIWDYDRKVWDQIVLFDRICWPVKTLAVHVCCPSSYIFRIVAPIIGALVGREKRSRAVFHGVPMSQIPDALAEYGIEKHMLPTFMGGTLECSPSGWVENRRAAEMEEL